MGSLKSSYSRATRTIFSDQIAQRAEFQGRYQQCDRTRETIPTFRFALQPGEIMNRIIAATALILVAAGTLGFSSPASAAEDWKIYPTIDCVPNGPASGNDLSYSYQGLINTSTTNNRVIICPLLNDVENFNSGFTDTVYFNYQTAAAVAGTVNCTVQVGFLASGFTSASTSEPEKPADSKEEASVVIPPLPANFLPPIHLVCVLSPRTRLTRILIHNVSPTNVP
jgi:hypothetical protein